jgi:hypothetical protein
MNDKLGWALVGLAFVAGYVSWGWRGLVLALTVVVFWMLLQFSRTLRLLRRAALSPMGRVDSAVMLNAKLRARMRLADVIQLTRSLGGKVADDPETYAWRDPGQAQVVAEFDAGRLRAWRLERPASSDDATG